MSCFLGECLHPLLLHFEGQWGDEGEGVNGELGFVWNLCTFTHKLIAGISHLPFCVLVLFICCTHACNYPLLQEMIHYTVEQLNWQMQSTTLLCPTSPSCLPFAPAITNLFSLSPNPYTSPFILSPPITHFPSFKSSSAILSSATLFFPFPSLGSSHPSPASTSPSLLPFLRHLHIYLALCQG